MKLFLFALMLSSAFASGIDYAAKPVQLDPTCLNDLIKLHGADYTERSFGQSSKKQQRLLKRAESYSASIVKKVLQINNLDVAIQGTNFRRSAIINASDDWFGVKVVLGESKGEAMYQFNRATVIFLATDSDLDESTALKPLSLEFNQHMGEDVSFSLCAFK